MAPHALHSNLELHQLMSGMTEDDQERMQHLVQGAVEFPHLLAAALDEAAYRPGGLARERMVERNTAAEQGVSLDVTIEDVALAVVRSGMPLRARFSPAVQKTLDRDPEYRERKRKWLHHPYERQDHLNMQVRALGIVAQVAAGTYEDPLPSMTFDAAYRLQQLLEIGHFPRRSL